MRLKYGVLDYINRMDNFTITLLYYVYNNIITLTHYQVSRVHIDRATISPSGSWTNFIKEKENLFSTLFSFMVRLGFYQFYLDFLISHLHSLDRHAYTFNFYGP